MDKAVVKVVICFAIGFFVLAIVQGLWPVKSISGVCGSAFFPKNGSDKARQDGPVTIPSECSDLRTEALRGPVESVILGLAAAGGAITVSRTRSED
ncbi:MAG TPA: hypothetical protein VFE15_14895 [Marmoricola sp.]|jgi:hypothetical protein|nr:hypothetical protein [Marmoricola sp.]